VRLVPASNASPTRAQWSVAAAYALSPGVYWLLNDWLPTSGPITLLIGAVSPIIAGFLIGERWAVLLAASGIGWEAAVLATNGLPPLLRPASPWQFGVATILTTGFDVLLIFCGIAARREARLSRRRTKRGDDAEGTDARAGQANRQQTHVVQNPPAREGETALSPQRTNPHGLLRTKEGSHRGTMGSPVTA